MYKTSSPGRVLIGRFDHGDDLLERLTELCKKENITAGSFQMVGAVQNAKLGYYSQDEKKYTGCVQLDKKLEIASCMGNISLKDGQVFVHAHIVLADYDGKAFGGHLMPGTKVFAAEFTVTELCGVTLERVKEPETGLPLWG